MVSVGEGKEDHPGSCAGEGEPFGRYRILEQLGKGGMGTVYLAVDTLTKRHVALKTIAPDASQAEADRFLREVRIAARLDHPGIVTIYDAGVEEGRAYYTMERIEGGSVADVTQAKCAQPPREACDLVRRTAEALHHAHEHGVIHRDIKPANILLDAEGHPHLADFGLARRLDDESLAITRTGQFLGTPAYLSPEQAHGDNDALDARTDVYSLGCVLYELLTGHRPFSADTLVKLLKKILDEDPIQPRRLNPDLPQDLAAVCLKAIEKRPQHRYANAAEFAADLGRDLDGLAVRARPVGPVRRFQRYLARSRKRVALLAVLVAAIAAALGFVVVRAREGVSLSVLREQEGGPPAEGRDYSLGLLLRASGAPEAETRCAALTALVRQGDSRARQTILAAVDDSDISVRLRVAGLAGRMTAERAAELLKPLLADAEPFVRVKALQEAARVKPKGLLAAVTRNLRHDRAMVCGMARMTLVRIAAPEEAECALAGVLVDPTVPPARKAELLGAMTSGLVPPLMFGAAKLLEAKDDALRAAAARLLQRCTGESLGTDADEWRAWLSERKDSLRVVCVGVVIDAPQGPLQEGDGILAIDGHPCTPGTLDAPPAGNVRLLRNGKQHDVTLHAPAEGIRLFPQHIVMQGNAIISAGEAESRLRGK